MSDGEPPEEDDEVVRTQWIHRTDDPRVEFARELATAALLVVGVGLVVTTASGTWPPFVAVESPSMTPNLRTGDLVFVVEEHRVDSPAAVAGTGVVTRHIGDDVGYTSFGEPGDVIVYRPDGSEHRTPIIHRAEFWVNASEDWYGKADPRYLRGESCDAVSNCPAPHAGFVTRGDANGRYDQASDTSEPVRPSWVRGRAEFRIPYLGHVRLAMGRLGPGAALGADHTSTTSRNATSIEAVSSNCTTAEPRTPTAA